MPVIKYPQKIQFAIALIVVNKTIEIMLKKRCIVAIRCVKSAVLSRSHKELSGGGGGRVSRRRSRKLDAYTRGALVRGKGRSVPDNRQQQQRRNHALRPSSQR